MGKNGFYYQTFDAAISREGDLMRVLDVLARDAGIGGVFSDCAGAGDLLRQLHGIEVEAAGRDPQLGGAAASEANRQ
jgi:hypothetical protein